MTSGDIVGVDVGGTFTDATLIDGATGEIRRAKVATTASAQQSGVLAALGELDAVSNKMSLFSHGTTVGLNAFLQRRGAKTGLICTEGTRDMLDMGRLRRDNADGLYDPNWKRPQQERPVVHRRYIREVPGRVRYDGTEHVGFDEQAVRRELEFLRDEGIDAVAVCLLNAYVNLDHERRVVDLVREILPDAYVQSSSFRPVVGEYTRTVAAVVDAYTGSVISQYLARLQEALAGVGYDGAAVIMQMNGGVRTLDRTMSSFPAYTLESGPVAGMLGAEYYGRKFVGRDNLVCIDIGGTSTDVGLVVGGEAVEVDEWEIEWGFTLGVPAIDVRSIGAGGGSLIQIDHMGTLRVGPESAGADPGPIAYGRGGTQPTITDAHVVMGTLRPETFLGGRMSLDVDAARAGIRRIADQLEMSPEKLASQAIKLMDAGIEAEVSRMVFDRGMDVRSFSLFAYGGAGALHAAEVARLAGIEETIVPQLAGGFSTIGLVTAPPKVEQSASRVEELSVLNLDEVAATFDGLEQHVIEDLGAQNVDAGGVHITRTIYGMYTGQSFSNEVPLDGWPLTPELMERWRARFDAMYDRLYGYSAPEIDVTITTLRVIGTGKRLEVSLPPIEGGGGPLSERAAARHPLHLGDEELSGVSFYDRERLCHGDSLIGPAVINDEATTIFVPAETTAEVDEYGNVRLTRLGDR
jgi:N-methylhydantoinase A